jgi:hypothetical protein
MAYGKMGNKKMMGGNMGGKMGGKMKPKKGSMADRMGCKMGETYNIRLRKCVPIGRMGMGRMNKDMGDM